MDMGALATALVAAWVIEMLVGAFVKPIWQRAGLDPFWLLYVVAVIAAPLAWFTGINALPVFAEAPVVGRVLTCLVIALGPSFIYDLTDREPALPAK
jgi:uncharacterized membrane protein